jgi:hypothetical protein
LLSTKDATQGTKSPVVVVVLLTFSLLVAALTIAHCSHMLVILCDFVALDSGAHGLAGQGVRGCLVQCAVHVPASPVLLALAGKDTAGKK